MHAEEDIRIKKFDMVTPVLLWLFLIICCLTFLVYMIQKNEQENIHYYYTAAKQNQFTIKNRIEGESEFLKTIAAGFNQMDSDYAQQFPDIIRKMNDQLNGMELAYSKNPDWEKLYKEDRYFHILISDDKEQPLGYLYWRNDHTMLNEMLTTNILTASGFCAIFDNQGGLIAGADHERKDGLSWNTKKEMIYKMISSKKEISSDLKIGEIQPEIAVLIPLEVNDWYLLNVFPESGLQGRYTETAVGIGIMILISSGLFFLFFYGQYKTIVHNQHTLETLAFTDPLTGCRNFYSFKKEARRILSNTDLTAYAVWYCDIKKFKFINDVLGYEEGDRILTNIAYLFQDETPNSLFCRVSADNFVGLYKYKHREELQYRFEKLVESLQQQEMSYNRRLSTELCMGVYCLLEDDRFISVDHMVNRANIAQKYIKNQPGNQFGFYDREIRNKVVEETELESEIEGAIERGEFKIFVQPKISIQGNNEIAGGEVLVRWQNPGKGMIPPGQFIPIMERAGKIVILDRYMFELSCKWLHHYLKSGKKAINLAVNVSKIGMLRDDFVDYYGSIKEKYKIPDGLLELEFTETVMLNDDMVFNHLVEKLHEKGFICSLDDFGAGYSSLNLLKNVSIDIVKLDIMFFRKSSDIKRERIVISNIINMAKELRIKTIAEGVEYTETVEFLKSAGCDVIQGYVFAKPMPIEEFEKLLLEKTLHPESEN